MRSAQDTDAQPAAEPLNIVFASHTAQAGVFRVGSHHYAREFARRGARVIHISTPVTLAHIVKLRSPEVRRRFAKALGGASTDRDGVVHVVPLLAAPTASLPDRIAAVLTRIPFRPWPRRRTVDVLVIDQPLLVDLIPILNPQLVVYRPTDVHLDPRVRRAEIRVIALADGVVATSAHVLADVMDGQKPLPTSVIENGVEFEKFSSGEASGAARSGAVYVGALDARFDWAAVTTLAAAFPEAVITIAGPVASVIPKDLASNIRLVGPVPYDQVPELLARAMIGLLPMSVDPANAGRSPMKYFEYLAAGLTVVASTTPELARRSAPNVYLYSGPDELVRAYAQAQDSDADRTAAGVEFAREYSWERRAEGLREFVESLGRTHETPE